MYELEEQETTINILESTGEIEIYSCAPNKIEMLLQFACQNNLPIKVMEIAKGRPIAVSMTFREGTLTNNVLQIV